MFFLLFILILVLFVLEYLCNPEQQINLRAFWSTNPPPPNLNREIKNIGSRSSYSLPNAKPVR